MTNKYVKPSPGVKPNIDKYVNIADPPKLTSGALSNLPVAENIGSDSDDSRNSLAESTVTVSR